MSTSRELIERLCDAAKTVGRVSHTKWVPEWSAITQSDYSDPWNPFTNDEQFTELLITNKFGIRVINDKCNRLRVIVIGQLNTRVEMSCKEEDYESTLRWCVLVAASTLQVKKDMTSRSIEQDAKKVESVKDTKKKKKTVADLPKLDRTKYGKNVMYALTSSSLLQRAWSYKPTVKELMSIVKYQNVAGELLEQIDEYRTTKSGNWSMTKLEDNK
jgi:hypothetical protein